jgi:hypothetical protein
MNIPAGTKACIAYVAGRLVSGKLTSSVYDFSQSKHVLISGTVNGQNIAIYDHDRACHFGGSGNGTALSLYDYGRSSHISLQIQGNQFSGYDHGAGTHYSGTVSGNSVRIYDHGLAGYTNYNF